MTERLYYSDPTLLAFDAVIVRIEKDDGKARVFLDCSAFYPTSGGQLNDLGWIGDAKVLDVVETDDGDVAHIVEHAPPAEGQRVHCQIEADRRLRHRRQHTAQHILSQVLDRLRCGETISVHLGEAYGAIELNVPELSPDQLLKAEHEANQIILENVPVETMFASVEEASKLPLRKQPNRSGTIRIIRVGDLDWSACGGTHCQSTAEVGLIKLTGTERIRGHVQVRFLSGQQALDDYRMRFDATDMLSRTLTCHVGDLVAKTEKLVTENRELRKDLAALQKELLPMRAGALAVKVATIGKWKLVNEVVSNLDSSLAGPFASMVADQVGGIAMLIADSKLILATAESTGLRAGQIARLFSERTGLRGGGSDRVAQFGGAQPERATEYRDVLMQLVNDE